MQPPAQHPTTPPPPLSSPPPKTPTRPALQQNHLHRPPLRKNLPKQPLARRRQVRAITPPPRGFRAPGRESARFYLLSQRRRLCPAPDPRGWRGSRKEQKGRNSRGAPLLLSQKHKSTSREPSPKKPRGGGAEGLRDLSGKQANARVRGPEERTDNAAHRSMDKAVAGSYCVNTLKEIRSGAGAGPTMPRGERETRARGVREFNPGGGLLDYAAG